HWCATRGFDLTFIEVMPMGEMGNTTRIDQYWPLSFVRKTLAKTMTLEDTNEQTPGPARYALVKETGQRLGFITPLTHNFCESCNRVRITCTGIMYMCLGQDDHVDLRRALRSKYGQDALEHALLQGIANKPKGHDFLISRRAPRTAVQRHMSVTGG
ncbi:MAG: GTP 3',8-cyclase MoaA, partial [Pseudomonadota bacterium]